MADSSGQDGKKGPARVYVHHFPKKRRDEGSQGEATPALDRAKTLPAMPALNRDDEITEPKGRRLVDPAKSERVPAAPKRKKRSDRSKDKPSSKSKSVSAPVEAPSDRALLAQRVLEGHQLFEQGQLDAARQVFEGIVAQGVADAFPHTMLGTIYLAQGAHERAVALFEEALALDPSDIAARVYRGEARLSRGRVELALEDLEQALQLAPAEDPFVERARRLLRIAGEMGRAAR